MKKNRKPLLFVAVPLLFYILAGYALWRLGFFPLGQSFMERAATIVCLVMICLAPLGIFSALTTRRAAKRQAADQNNSKAGELRLRSLKYLIRGLFDLVVGGIGYYVVTRRVFSQVDPTWILIVVVLPTSLVEIAFHLKLKAQKIQSHRVPSH